MLILQTFMLYLTPVLVAALVGGLIGVEREYRDKSAGFRTMMLVAIGACVFTLLSDALAGKTEDSTRIAAAVVTGVGFLGAGVVLKDGMTVKGVTTAASIWLAAALGMTAAARQYELIIIVTLLALVILWIIPPFERMLNKLYEFIEIDLKIKNSDDTEDDILEIFDELNIKVVQIRRTREEKGERTLHILVKLNAKKRKDLSEILVNEKDVLAFSV